MDRRSFIRHTAIAGSTAIIRPVAAAEKPPAEAPAAMTDVTQTLARHLVTAKFDDLPAAVRREAARSLVNWVAVAVGGSHHEAVEIALAAVAPFAGSGQAAVLGRKE